MVKSRVFSFFLMVVLIMSNGILPSETAYALSYDVVISQVYGGGGNSGAPYTHDFVEVFNRGSSTVSLAGWSIQYASATGTALFSSNATALNGSIAPKQYFLIRLASGGANGAALPTADHTGTTALSATGGKIILANTSTGLACNGSSTPCSSTDLEKIVDLVGFGSANFYEGSGPAPAGSNTAAVLRANSGCREYDDNLNDFAAVTPLPRNSSSPAAVCNSIAPVGTGAANPTSLLPDENSLLTVTVRPGDYPPSGGLSVSGNLSSIGGSASQTFYDDATHGDISAGDNIFSFAISIPSGTQPGAKTLPFAGSDAQARSFNGSISLTVQFAATAIHDIQGSAHLSPLSGTQVTTQGIVTGLRSRGFYMQSDAPDANDSTSEGIYIFLDSAPTVSVGDSITVTGTVLEGSENVSTECLKTTQLVNPGLAITVNSTGNPLPTPTVLGIGGRNIPDTIIEDDASNVEITGTFDPASDAIDLFESLEGMLVQVNDPVAVGPTDSANELPVLADNGVNASVRSTRGGIVVRELAAGQRDYNPERIILDDEFSAASMPDVNAGAHLSSPVIGVMDYIVDYFGGCNYKLEVAATPTALDDTLARESASVPETGELSIATFNVENLDPTDPAAKFTQLAGMVINDLKSPDILAIEEVQDNNGATNDGTVDASTTWNMLITAITTAGGPIYSYRQINPVNNNDGGDPGGNIRVGFLYRTDRGLTFVDRPGATSTTANSVIAGSQGPELKFSPGRIEPTNSAFSVSRKPLAGEFTFHGVRFFVIATHFNSKSGDQPLFGVNQPPVLSSEAKRVQQATIVKTFVQNILALDTHANVIVLGDMNDFEFSSPLSTLEAAPLHILSKTLPQAERYTYVYEGNSEAIDHTLLSDALFARPIEYDIVHVNAEFVVQASDHDPQVTHILFNNPACHFLTISHSGQGTSPSASPTHSPACPYGYYTSGEAIQFSGAVPAASWAISGWTGTNNDTSKAASNVLTMPNADHGISVAYVQPAIPGILTLTAPANEAVLAGDPPSLDWNEPTPGAESYQVQLAISNTFTTGILYDQLVSSSSFSIPASLPHGQKLYWRVRGINLLGQTGAWSSIFSFYISSGWQVNQSDNILHIHYDQGTIAPEYAALHLQDGYFRMNYGPSSGWGTSVLLMPSFWSGGEYYQGTPVQAVWQVDGLELVLTVNGTMPSHDPGVFSLAVTSTLRISPPEQNEISAHFATNTSVTGTLQLDDRPNEAFKPVMLSSMHINSSQWDTQSAYAGCRTFSPPASGWFMPSPVSSQIFGLHGGTSYWKTNAPTVEITLDQALPVTGWVTSSADPNDDNVALWAAADHVLSSWSFVIHTFATPEAPAMVSPRNGTTLPNGAPVLDWNEIPDGTSYQVQVSDNSNFVSLLQEHIGSASAYAVIPALDPHNQYFWHVQGCNSNGRATPWSPGWVFQTPLATPETLNAPANNEHVLTLRPNFDWSDVPGAAYYILQISKTETFTPLVLSETAEVSSLIPREDLPPGSLLYWRVRSEGTGGTGKWSVIRTFTTPNPPGIPKLIAPTTGAPIMDTHPLFKWLQVTIPRNTEFDHYQIQVSTDPDFSSLVVDETISDASITMFTPDTALSSGTQFYWRLRAFNKDNEFSSWSDVRSFTIPAPWADDGRPHVLSVDPTIPLPKLLVDGVGTNISGPVLDWTDVPNADSYIVQVSTDPGFISTTLIVSATTIDSQYAFIKDSPAVNLYWRVLVIQSNKISNWTAISVHLP